MHGESLTLFLEKCLVFFFFTRALQPLLQPQGKISVPIVAYMMHMVSMSHIEMFFQLVFHRGVGAEFKQPAFNGVNCKQTKYAGPF